MSIFDWFRKRKIHNMGVGETLISWGTVNKVPCIVLVASPEKGQTGAPAPQFKQLAEAEGTIITFANRDAIENFKAKLDMIAEEFE